MAAKKDRPGYYSLKIRNKFNTAFRTAILGVKDGNVSQVHISAHNSKMGYVASVSLLPFNSCPALCAGTCGKDCYAAKLANLRPNVLQDYAENMAMAMFRRDEYFAQVNLAMAGVRFFRYHVGGDFPDADYFDRVVKSAIDHPHCEVLAFTKRWEIVNIWIAEHGDLPGNLHIMFSGWTGLKPVNPYGLPETNIIERGCDPEEGWTICGGNCFNCGLACSGCFGAQCGDVIAFHKH